MIKYLPAASIFIVALSAGCLQNDEIKLSISCDGTDISEKCSQGCADSFNSSLKAWRCSASGQPVCICESYRDAGQYIGG